ncbi:MAG: PLAT/LH2 domain-containing protein [Aggregatilineales bacterium]
MARTNIYTVWVKTGDQTLAGTDSNVFIQMFGTTGQTASIHLPAQDVFSFEAGSTDKYVLEVPDIGDLTRCCIGHDNEEGDSGWYVVDVRVQDDETDREWVFTFDQWLGVEESGKLFACVDL